MFGVIKAIVLIPLNATLLFWSLVLHVTIVYPLTLTYDCLQLYFRANKSEWFSFDVTKFIPQMNQLSNTFFYQSLVLFERSCMDNIVDLLKEANTQEVVTFFNNQLEYLLSIISGGCYMLANGESQSFSLVNVSDKTFDLPYRMDDVNLPQEYCYQSLLPTNKLTCQQLYLGHIMMTCAKAIYEHYEVVMDLAAKWGCSEEAWQIQYRHRRGPKGKVLCPETKMCIFPFPDMIVLAFCGTEPLNFLMWYTDFSMELIDEKEGVPADMGRVHAGFYKALTFVPPADQHNTEPDCLFNVIHAKMKQLNKKNLPIYVCGHSLGAACASMFSALCASKPPELKSTFQPEDIEGVYTFGQPRVGNLDYCLFVEQHYHDKYFRFVNATDIVTRGPWGNYVHHGKEYFINSYKEIKDRSDDIAFNGLREVLGMFFWYTPYKFVMGRKIYGETKLRSLGRCLMPPFISDHFTSDYQFALAVNCEKIKRTITSKCESNRARVAGEDY